ncbi:hypothetical protein YC2023_031028 [Brassica napus]
MDVYTEKFFGCDFYDDEIYLGSQGLPVQPRIRVKFQNIEYEILIFGIILVMTRGYKNML